MRRSYTADWQTTCESMWCGLRRRALRARTGRASSKASMGCWGKRGIPGMLRGITFARTRKVPFLGICLGMQCAVIEYARNACGLQGADSSEFDPATPHRVIYKLRELRGVDELGGTMRLGAWQCNLQPGSF